MLDDKKFLRDKLDILFVGLNPGNKSSENGHYFSTKDSLWKQLCLSGLIKELIDKEQADDIVFSECAYINYKNWQYGITDLVNIPESDSSKVEPTENDREKLYNAIKKHKPQNVVMLHSKVIEKFFEYVFMETIKYGEPIEKQVDDTIVTFWNVPFPHGNNISDKAKIGYYKTIKKYIETKKAAKK